MQTITTVDELKTLIKEKVLPAYEAAYNDVGADFGKLKMDRGICYYCRLAMSIDVYDLYNNIIEGLWICDNLIIDGYTKEEAIRPRIEWMRKFINE